MLIIHGVQGLLNEKLGKFDNCLKKFSNRLMLGCIYQDNEYGRFAIGGGSVG